MRFLTAILVVSALCGCATTTVVIPSDKRVRYLPEGQSVTAPPGGLWIVPPARMQEILRRLTE